MRLIINKATHSDKILQNKFLQKICLINNKQEEMFTKTQKMIIGAFFYQWTNLKFRLKIKECR